MSDSDPLDEEIKATIRDSLDRLRSRTENFRTRSGQNRLIAEVARTLSGSYASNRVLIAEAPTGTGKSVAYLLGAIPVAKAQGMRLVISTATVALQEQLINHDLPKIRDDAGMDFSFEIAKGRKRYVCNRNLTNLTGSDARQQEMDMGEEASAAWDYPPSDVDRETVAEMEAALGSDANPWAGDLDQWSGELSPDLRRAITTDRFGCLNHACPHFRQCAFMRARGRLFEADVIVANHDLVLSDLKAGGGKLLPPPEDVMYIFDEGHHLDKKAMQAAAASTSVAGGRDVISRAKRIVHESASVLRAVDVSKSEAAIEAVEDITREISDRLDDAEREIEQRFPEQTDSEQVVTQNGSVTTWRFKHGVVPESLSIPAMDLEKAIGPLVALLEKQRTAMTSATQESKINPRVSTKTFQSLGSVMTRAMEMERAWSGLGEEPESVGEPPAARWIERDRPGGKGRAQYTVSFASTSAARFLRGALFDQAAGVMMTSATLTSLGRFDRLRESCGLSKNDGTQYLRIASPFDYAGRAELCVPMMEAEPNQVEAHTRGVSDFINQRVDRDAGTLVLFSAKRQLQSVLEQMDPALKAQVLVQGEKPKAQIISEHARRIATGSGSLIFGLASFAEGVDLPGKLCEHVIIAKIPFAVPDSPVDATYAEYLESNGRNPFMEVTVPDAGVRLVQACGRLIRAESDSGRISLLDRRVVTKRYGKLLLDGLPGYRRNIEHTVLERSA